MLPVFVPAGSSARPRSLRPALEALRVRLLRASCGSSSEASGDVGVGLPSLLIAAGGRARSAATTTAAPGVPSSSSAPTTTPTCRAWTTSRAFSQADVDAFVTLTGDANPLHRAPGATAAAVTAGTPPPPSPLVPGLLLASLFPAIIGSEFPGSVYARQGLRFRAPARVGEAVVAEVSMSPALGSGGSAAAAEGEPPPPSPSSSRVAFDTVVRRAEDGRVLVEGSALAIVPLDVQRRVLQMLGSRRGGGGGGGKGGG